MGSGPAPAGRPGMTDFGNRRILAQPRGNVVEDRDADLERHQPPPDVATKFAAIGVQPLHDQRQCRSAEEKDLIKA